MTDLLDVDLVHLLDGGTDLWLVGVDVNNKHQGVVVLDLLHGGLSGEGVLDDVVSVHPVPAGGRLAWVLRSPGWTEGLGTVELHAGSHLGN